MKKWLAKKLIQGLLAVLDTVCSNFMNEERALAWRRATEDATIGRAMKLEQRPWWKKKRANNAFSSFMVVFLKSNRLTEFKENGHE